MSIYKGIPEIDLTLEMIVIPNLETNKTERIELKPNIDVIVGKTFIYSYHTNLETLTFIGRSKSGIRYTFAIPRVNPAIE